MKAYRLSLVCGLLALRLHAAPAMGLVRATPMTAIIGTPTQITVTASISDPTLIPASVDLLQLNPDGTTNILGTLHDDGLNGDASAGDLVFTLLVTLNAPTASQIQLQVSAAFKGTLQRVKSSTTNIFFQASNAPQQSVAALAQNLTVGNTAAAMNYLVATNKTTSALSSFGQPALNALASMLQAGVLVISKNDLRVFRAPFVTPTGATTVEFSMIPGPNGQWMINSW
jgi:hypothetical protein